MDLDRDVEDRLREHKEEIRTQKLQVQQQYTKLDTADQNFHVGMACCGETCSPDSPRRKETEKDTATLFPAVVS